MTDGWCMSREIVFILLLLYLTYDRSTSDQVFGHVWQHAITEANVGGDLSRHMVSLGNNESFGKH